MDNLKTSTLKKEKKFGMFDIVVPVGPNDIDIIKQQIEYTKKNIIGYRNIYIISSDKSLNIDDCITISEDIFPFTKETVSNFHGKISRNGWYLQQLIKLYAGLVIPNILGRYLVIDSDTFFLKPTTFIKDDKCLYNFSKAYHKPYFDHMKKLDKNLIRQDINKSGICHHMMFETKYIKILFNQIENAHHNKFYNVFLKNVVNIHTSGASEYEIYFNFMLKYYPDKIIVRNLKWRNVDSLEKYIEYNYYDYISYHWYMR